MNSMHSLTAFGLPGKLMMSVFFLIPAAALESMAVGVLVIEYALMASAIPGAILSHTAIVASGVRSLSEKPVLGRYVTAGKNVEADRKSIVAKAVRKAFPPEFTGRVDEQIFFNSLSKENIEDIIDIQLRDLKFRAAEAGYKLRVTPSAKRFVADAGYDPAYGARPLKRAVTKYIEDPVSEFIISDRILQDRQKETGAERILKIALSADKEHIEVSLA